RVLLADGAPRDDVLKRVEVDADEAERLDLVLLERRLVVRPVLPGQDRRVDPRVERLDAAAEELWHLGDLLDRRHRDPELGQEGRSAAARHELDVERHQPARELLEPGLVVDGDQRAFHAISSRTTCGRRRCSTDWTRERRLCSSSPGSTGTGSAAITGPLSIPPST